MRRAILIGLLCVACTRVNPAFDERLTLGDAGSEGDGDGDGDGGDGDGDGDGDADSSTSEGMQDLGTDPVMCQYMPSDGLAIQVGAPQEFGGECPQTVDRGAKILSGGGGQIVIQECEQGCDTCYAIEHMISTFPLLLDGHVPSEIDKCMSIEAHGFLGDEGGVCRYGGLTIYEGGTPFVIATAHSYEPSPRGLMFLLGTQMPQPVKAGNCNCDAIGQGNDCCYTALGPPEFWYYPFDGADLFPGDYGWINVPNAAGLEHVFKVFQAQRIYSCEAQDLELSWAVVAEFE